MSTRRAAASRATVIRGAHMHNLQHVDCHIPLGQITVITGVSGSGKSTLAFDTLYAEGQRRFVECLSAYARQFMERLARPAAEKIGYLQPPIALKQHVSIKNARSTVGSITELSDYLRLLFAQAADLHCLACGGAVQHTGIEEALAAVHRYPTGSRLAIVAPLEAVPDAAQLRRLRGQGYSRLLLGRTIWEIDALLAGERRARPVRTVGVVLDRVIVGRTPRGRIAEALEGAWQQGNGVARLQRLETAANGSVRGAGPPRTLRAGLACRDCGAPAHEPRPGLFSWNSPLGACPTCQGFGRVITLDHDKVVPDRRRTLRNHAVVPFSVPSGRAWYRRLLAAARRCGVPTDLPFETLSAEQQQWVFSGDEDFPGVEGLFRVLERKRYKMHVRIFIARFRGYAVCPTCHGSRLRPEALTARLGGRGIDTLHAWPIETLRAFLDRLRLPPARRKRVRALLESVRGRLLCLEEVGVGYLTLDRSGRSLSGGETQRIRIAAALGNALTETLFILDEPTVGLHAADTERMLAVLHRLAATGNTVVVVEHDPQVIVEADHLIVLGPGGGRQGGRLIYEGAPRPFLKSAPEFFVAGETAVAPRPPVRRGARGSGARRRTGRLQSAWDGAAVADWLARQRGGTAPRAPGGTAARTRAPFAAPAGGTPAAGRVLELREAQEHNLHIPYLMLPLGGLTAITGVSGSGKSTLLDQVLHRNWLRAQGRPVEGVGQVAALAGWEGIEELHFVGQEPLGRSSRSNPISFVQAYAEIRRLLAGTLAARQRGLQPGAFSFNTAGGRCEACHGMGTQTLEMYFLPDVEVPCDVCHGARFGPEVLGVTWQGRTISQILELTVDEASEFFVREPRIVNRLAPLRDVGLGYLLLGQSTATLSGGEAQRLKIASFLASGPTHGHHLFLFDEPTTGLHARDVGRLLGVLRALIMRGHSVIAVEHHLDFIRAADWVIDLGPGPGDAGGRVVYAGPAAGLPSASGSRTGDALRAHLARVASWR